GVVHAHGMVRHGQKKSQRLAHRLLVIDDVYDHICAHVASVSSSMAGTVNRNVAPPCALRSMSIAPPCDSTMRLDIESPTPMPPGFVVMKGLKSCWATSSASPGPVSETSISASSDWAVADVRTTSSR